MPSTGSRNTDILERLDRIEVMVSAIHSMLMHEKQGQAEEIEKYIQRWREGLLEPVPVAD